MGKGWTTPRRRRLSGGRQFVGQALAAWAVPGELSRPVPDRQRAVRVAADLHSGLDIVRPAAVRGQLQRQPLEPRAGPLSYPQAPCPCPQGPCLREIPRRPFPTRCRTSRACVPRPPGCLISPPSHRSSGQLPRRRPGRSRCPSAVRGCPLLQRLRSLRPHHSAGMLVEGFPQVCIHPGARLRARRVLLVEHGPSIYWLDHHLVLSPCLHAGLLKHRPSIGRQIEPLTHRTHATSAEI